MKKIIMALVTVIMFSCINIAGAVSGDSLVTEDSIEPNQTTGSKCMVGALYLETLCLIADGNPQKCTNMSSLIYGLPCLFYDGIFGDDEISLTKCMLGLFYIEIACLACEGNVFKCQLMSTYNFYFPCMYRALNADTDVPESNP